MTENDEKLADEKYQAICDQAAAWAKTHFDWPRKFCALYDGYMQGFGEGIAHQKKKTEELEQFLTAIRYEMSADGIKDETFYLNLKLAIDQTLKDYEKENKK